MEAIWLEPQPLCVWGKEVALPVSQLGHISATYEPSLCTEDDEDEEKKANEVISGREALSLWNCIVSDNKGKRPEAFR